MMILLLVFLLLATTSLIWSLEYQIGSPENRSIESLPEHGSKENIEITYVYTQTAEAYKVILAGIVTVAIGVIIFANYCIRRKLYGRLEVVSFVLTLVCLAGAVLVRSM